MDEDWFSRRGGERNDHFVSYAAMISGILCNQRAPSTPLLNACCTNSSFIERVYHARSGFHMLPARLLVQNTSETEYFAPKPQASARPIDACRLDSLERGSPQGFPIAI